VVDGVIGPLDHVEILVLKLVRELFFDCLGIKKQLDQFQLLILRLKLKLDAYIEGIVNHLSVAYLILRE